MERCRNNIFTYHRIGPHRNQQLERNTTKNLLKVLNDTDKKGLQTFLRQAFPGFPAIDQDAVEIELEASIDAADYTGQDTYLLGISRRGRDVATDDPSTDEQSCIDGLIRVRSEERQATIGVEVKTGDDSLKADQMAKYKHELSITDSAHSASLQWRAVYGLFADLAVDPAFSEKDTYLFQEYADYLEYEQLTTVVAEHRGNPSKRLRLRRQPSDTDNWTAGELMVKITWETADERESSGLGWISAEVFEDLLTDLPPRIRNAAFGGDSVSYNAFIEQVYEEWPEIKEHKDRNIAHSKRLPDGSSRRLRLKWISDDDRNLVRDVPDLRIVEYTSDGTYNRFAVPPNLDPDAFEGLFGDIPKSVRQDVFCEEPNLERLWTYYLNQS